MVVFDRKMCVYPLPILMKYSKSKMQKHLKNGPLKMLYSRSCLIQHTKRSGKCVRLYRMSEPVLSNTPRNQGNVSDCTGCWNTQVLF